jgi:hypothetical protein
MRTLVRYASATGLVATLAAACYEPGPLAAAIVAGELDASPPTGDAMPGDSDASSDASAEGDDASSDADAGPVICEPGAVERCYTGATSTVGVGRCHGGVIRCSLDGTEWSSCLGAVLPSASEDCSTPEDDDCNGVANEICACNVGTTRTCYDGPAGTLGIGPCKAGVQTCSTPNGFGSCADEIVPQAETCNGIDDDCNGFVDEGACPCVPKSVMSCYTGPIGTDGIGSCTAGLATCKDDGSGFGPCVGDVLPSPETCGNSFDDDCNGQLNESGANCVCKPGSSRACYTGPASTENVGACVSGTETCNANGLSYGTCTSQVLPTWEDCDKDGDEDCNGSAAAACHTFVWGAADSEQIPSVARGMPNGDVMWVRHRLYTLDLRRLAAANGSSQTLATIPIDGDAAIDASGNVFVGGACSGTTVVGSVTVSCGTGGAFVLKVGSDGNAQWAKSWSGPTQPAFGIDDAGDVALVVYTASTDFGDGARVGTALIRLTAGGALVWSRVLSVEYPIGRPAVDATRVIVPGSTAGVAHFEVHDATGLVQDHSWNEPAYYAASAVFDASGGYWLSRPNEVDRFDDAHGLIHSESIAARDLVGLPSGGVLARSNAGSDFTRFDSTGTPVAHRDVGTYVSITGVSGDGSSLYIAGTRYDYYLATGAVFRGGTIGGPDQRSFVAKLSMNE